MACSLLRELLLPPLRTLVIPGHFPGSSRLSRRRLKALSELALGHPGPGRRSSAIDEMHFPGFFLIPGIPEKLRRTNGDYVFGLIAHPEP